MNLTKATCLRKSKATTRRKFPPAISNLTRSRFNTFDFGAALCTSSVEVQCAALTSLCQRSSVTLASGCSLQKATSVFRATTLISLVNMFPKWEQVLVKLEGPFRPRTRRGTAANAIENASAAEADEACIYFSAKRRSAKSIRRRLVVDPRAWDATISDPSRDCHSSGSRPMHPDAGPDRSLGAPGSTDRKVARHRQVRLETRTRQP